MIWGCLFIIPALDAIDITAALREFQEHLGGEMAITLLTGIGSKKEVNRIDTSLMKRCIEELLVREDGSRGMEIDLTGECAHPPGELQ